MCLCALRGGIIVYFPSLHNPQPTLKPKLQTTPRGTQRVSGQTQGCCAGPDTRFPAHEMQENAGTKVQTAPAPSFPPAPATARGYTREIFASPWCLFLLGLLVPTPKLNPVSEEPGKGHWEHRQILQLAIRSAPGSTGRASGRPLTFHSTREASPVGEDHERQPLSVEVIDGLRSLEGRVREPHLASLLDYLLGRKQTGRP